MKRIWKVLGFIGLAVLLAGGYSAYRIALDDSQPVVGMKNSPLI